MRTHHAPLLPRSLGRLSRLLALAAAVVAGLAVTGATAPSAHAACIYPTPSFYPGSALTHARYAQVTYRFKVCTGNSSQFSASVIRSDENATGQNVGFFLKGSTVSEIGEGRLFKRYEGRINWQTCTPRIGWPCRKSGTFRILFLATQTSREPVFHVQQIIQPYLGFAIFRSP